MKWEIVDNHTRRSKVDSGWIYEFTIPRNAQVVFLFVPKPRIDFDIMEAFGAK